MKIIFFIFSIKLLVLGLDYMVSLKLLKPPWMFDLHSP